MTDSLPSPSPSSTTAVAGESPAQLKARLRRERLAAKSGASRLQQITALQGGPPKTLRELEKDVPGMTQLLTEPPRPSVVLCFATTHLTGLVTPSSTPPRASATATTTTTTQDPDEVDISSHNYAPAALPRRPSPFAFDGVASDALQDPLMAMLQQMMGDGSVPGMPSLPGASGNPGAPQETLPPGLANMFGGTVSTEPEPDHSSAWLWRLIHSVFSLGLAMYIVLQTPFNGSKMSRDNVVDDNWALQSASTQTFAHFFYLFATFELVLQTSRYFIEKGQLQGSGVLSTVAGILPAPYSAYVRTIGRYSVIYSTVVSDVMVVVFVLGASSWWQGAAVA